MDATRVDRRPPAPGGKERITQPLPVADEATRIKPGRRRPSGRLGFAERVALVAHSLDRDTAHALVTGLSHRGRERAEAFLSAFAAGTSAERQGRLAAEFGIRTDAAARLREVWAEAGPFLRRELYAQLPPFHRSVFPDYVLKPRLEGEDVGPGLADFAERLIREATR